MMLTILAHTDLELNRDVERAEIDCGHAERAMQNAAFADVFNPAEQ